MFLNLFVADPLVETTFMLEVLLEFFISAVRVRHLMYIEPINSSDLMTRFKDKLKFQKLPSLGKSKHINCMLLERTHIIPDIFIRPARVEDCDDLLPMFKRHHMMKKDASDYEISKLIESDDPNTKTLVAIISGKVIGFVSLYQLVEKKIYDIYFLEPYKIALSNVGGNISNTIRTEIPIGKSIENLITNSRYSLNNNFGESRRSKLELGHGSTQKLGEIKLTEAFSISRLSKNSLNENKNYPSGSKNEESIGNVLQRKKNKENVKNAFCISLFCMENKYSGLAIEFLKHIFCSFPDRDYLFLTLPSTEMEHHLLQSFTKIPPNPGLSPRHGLYLATRAGALSDLTVRKAQIEDSNQIFELLENLPMEAEIIKTSQNMKNSESNPKENALVVLFGSQIIGLLITEYIEPTELMEQFNLAKYISLPRKSAMNLLTSFILSPVFFHESKKILEQALNLCSSHYFLYLETRDILTEHMVSFDFVPVPRIQRVLYPNNLNDGQKVGPTIKKSCQIFCSQFIYEPRIRVNAKIVVVGCSDTSVGFLENLFFTSFVQYKEVTLISKEGMSRIVQPILFNCYDTEELEQLGIHRYVNVVHGVVVCINRSEKSIVLESEEIIPYDILILSPGFSYQPPEYENVTAIGKDCISDIDYCARTQYWTDAPEIAAIVYGSSIECLSTIEELLKRGVLPKKICWINPEPGASMFKNSHVKGKVLQSLNEMIHIHEGKIIRWTEKDGYLERVTIKPVHFILMISVIMKNSLKFLVNFYFTAIKRGCLQKF
jgi:hypothetical protein